MRNCFFWRLLGCLLALNLFVGLGLAPTSVWAADTPAVADAGAQPLAQIKAADEALEKIRAALDDANAPETLQALSDKAQASKRDADAAVTALEPMLTQVDARIKQLGPVAEDATEGSDISQQRKQLGQERGDIDSAVKRGKLISVEAAQLTSSIEKMRSQQFNEEISRKAASPLSLKLWQQFAEHVPNDLQRMQALARQGVDTFNAAIAEHGWKRMGGGIALALLLVFPLRMWLRHLGRRYASSSSAPDGRLRRSGLAVWQLLLGTLLPWLAAMVLIESLRSINAIAPRLESVADAFVKASFVAAIFVSVSKSLLVPKRPSWRLLNVDDIAAAPLTRYAWAAAALTWFAMMLNAVDIASRTSSVSTVAVDGLIALTYVGLIVTVLFTLNKMRSRQSDASAKEREGDSGHPVQRSGWLMLAWLGGHLTILAALIAALFGYLNFSVFVATQMVWMTVVVLSTSLFMKFADDFSLWLFSTQSRSGKAVAQTTGISESHLAQIGVLLSALLRIFLVLLGIAAITAPFGNSHTLFGWMDALSHGLKIGDAVLRPSAILRALAVLVLGLTLFRTLQHWLVNTYLPKTDFDIGARNSISTMARYVGIILSGLWTLAALGIGFEKVALLASALSVGIGFGLQAITQNFVSGLILLAERPVKLGDRIAIGDLEGDIRRINVRATEIQMDDRSTLIVPNSELITKSVRNITMDGPVGRAQMKFAVPLSTDIVLLREILMSIYADHEAVLQSPAPNFFIDSLNGSVVNINTSGFVSSPRNTYSTRSDLLFELLKRTTQAGIALVSATDIHVIRDPDVPASAPAPAESAPTTRAQPDSDRH